MNELLLSKAKNARTASRQMVKYNTRQKNNALLAIAELLDAKRDEIKKENQKDLVNGHEKGLSKAMLDRLELTDKRVDGMISVIKDVVNLPDPVGEITSMWTLPNGLKVGKMRMPLGVIGIIFESRPNVCIEVAALTIKSGNSVILRGGSEAIHSNICLISLIKEGIRNEGLPEGSVEVIDKTDRALVKQLLKMKDYLDVIIPRGGLNLIRFVEENSVIPVIRHDLGICHTYIDEFANLDMALSVSYNAKVQRPGVCNAMETLLVHSNIASSFLLPMTEKFEKAGVELRGCEKTRQIIPKMKKAEEKDWSTEYLDLILSVKIVESNEEAISHINEYSSHHSDAIITDNHANAMQFLNEVDSAACYINASTRFTDGNEFGLGAEMGISNQKLHVRGPMGLKELTSTKFIIFGNGQTR